MNLPVPSNIKIQRAGPDALDEFNIVMPAADLERYKHLLDLGYA